MKNKQNTHFINKHEKYYLVRLALINALAENDLNETDALAILMMIFTGTMEKVGYSIDFFDRTVEKMKEDFRLKRAISEVDN